MDCVLEGRKILLLSDRKNHLGIIKDEFENKTTVLLQNLTIGQKYSNQLFIPEDFGDQN